MIRRFLRALALRFVGVGQLRADRELREPKGVPAISVNIAPIRKHPRRVWEGDL